MQPNFLTGTEHESRFFDLLKQCSEEKEFEIRFGKFVYDKNAKSSSFTPDVGMVAFHSIKYQMSLHTKAITEINTTEELYENGLKKVVNQKDNSTTFHTKKLLRKYDLYDYDIRLALSQETKLKDRPENIGRLTGTRKKQRTSFFLESGKVDATVVEESFGGEAPITKYEIEFEVDPAKKQNESNVIGILTVILQMQQDNFYIISNKESRYVRGIYKSLIGASFFIGAQAETLQKKQLSNLYKTKYSVTDKADGLRCFCFIDSHGYVYFVKPDMSISKTDLKSSDQSVFSSILDGELVRSQNSFKFYAFDILCFSHEDLRGKSNYFLKERLALMEKVVSSIESSHFYTVYAKEFIFKNVFVGSKYLLQKQTEYHKDGLIFTPIEEPYPKTRKWSSLLKWKPADQNSIDFYSVQDPQDPTIWSLYVQQPEVYDKECKIVSGKGKADTKVLFDINTICGSPQTDFKDMITFKTKMDDDALKFFHSNTVIEYRWDFGSSKFVPMRTRWDKTADPRKHGNHASVAFSIWNNIHHPVTLENLFQMTYYTHNDNSSLIKKNLLKWESEVKKEFFDNHSHKVCILTTKYEKYPQDIPVIIPPCQKQKEVNLQQNVFSLNLLEDNNTLTSLVAKNSVDAVFCQDFNNYMSNNEEVNLFIDSMDKLLKQDGKVILVFFDKQSLESESKPKICLENDSKEIVFYIDDTRQGSISVYSAGIYEEPLFNSWIPIQGTDLIVEMFSKRGYVKEHFSNGNGNGLFVELKSCLVFSKKSPVPSQMIQNELVEVELEPELKPESDELHDSNKIMFFKVESSIDIANVLNCIDYEHQCIEQESETYEQLDLQMCKNIFAKHPCVKEKGLVANPDELQETGNVMIYRTIDENDIRKFYIVAYDKNIVLTKREYSICKELINQKEASEKVDETEFESEPDFASTITEAEDIQPGSSNIITDDQGQQNEIETDTQTEKSSNVEISTDLRKKTVKQLKEMLKMAKMKISGSKQELIDRLESLKIN